MTILFGVAVGIAGIVIYSRLRATARDEDSDKLIERLAAQLDALENRAAEKKPVSNAS